MLNTKEGNPPESLVCQTCTECTLFTTSEGMKAFCGVMHVISFDSKYPREMVLTCSSHSSNE